MDGSEGSATGSCPRSGSDLADKDIICQRIAQAIRSFLASELETDEVGYWANTEDQYTEISMDIRVKADVGIDRVILRMAFEHHGGKAPENITRITTVQKPKKWWKFWRRHGD